LANSNGVPLIHGYRSKSNIYNVTKYNEISIDWREYIESLKITTTTSEVKGSVTTRNPIPKTLEGSANLVSSCSIIEDNVSPDKVVPDNSWRTSVRKKK